MGNKELEVFKEKYADYIESLDGEQKKEIDSCTTMDELRKFIAGNQGEIPDELAEAVAGGVQAGDIFKRTRTEFGGKPRHDETDAERRRRLMIEKEGKSYL